MISIVCASNNSEILKNELLNSIKQQTFKNYEVIIVDTNSKKFKSAAEALNYGGHKAKGDYIIFTYHDVIMKRQDELENIVKNLNKLGDFGIIGIAGIDSKGKIIGNITNGIPETKISKIRISDCTEVETLDEVMFIISRDNFINNPLITENKTWHLYAVEYCLYMNDIGKKVFVIPSEIYHKSAGASMNKSYYKEIKRICNIYQNKIKSLKTTMGIWHTNKFLLYIDIIKIRFLLKLIKIKTTLLTR